MFVDAYSATTGRPVRVPEHFLDHPVIGQGFRKTPLPGVHTETPDESWTIPDLKEHAAKHDIDLAGATVKADILTAINTHHDTPA